MAIRYSLKNNPLEFISLSLCYTYIIVKKMGLGKTNRYTPAIILEKHLSVDTTFDPTLEMSPDSPFKKKSTS